MEQGQGSQNAQVGYCQCDQADRVTYSKFQGGFLTSTAITRISIFTRAADFEGIIVYCLPFILYHINVEAGLLIVKLSKLHGLRLPFPVAMDWKKSVHILCFALTINQWGKS